MSGLYMGMGLGGGGAYQGPVFGADSPAAVPPSQGYPDTRNAALLFGPTGTSGGGLGPHHHSMMFGLLCFAGLLFFAWALPR